jgi:hypothetical protein
MRIVVTRTGGFAGVTRRAELDTAGRPDAERLRALARDVLADGRTAAVAAGMPDGFGYEITIDDETVRCAEPRLTGAQRELIEAVLGD